MTRKSQVYHNLVSKQEGIQDVPYVDESKDYPQGLAGNSAYIMTPKTAEQLLIKTKEIGMWPNDAIMCKQLCPWIKCYKPYLTECQGIKSTTSK